MLLMASVVLGLSQYWFASVESFNALLLCRVVQSLLYPALFIAAVTYCSQAGGNDRVAARVSLYVATTIMGGYLGRLSSGFMASWYDWTVIFKLLAACLCTCSILLWFATKDTTVRKKNSDTSIASILRQPTFQAGFCLIFTTFFAFSATLNALPFRLVSIDPDISAATISLVYSGYLAGIIIASNTTRLAQLAGGRVSAMTIALSIFTAGLALLVFANVYWMMAICFLTASGFFLIHSTLSGYLTSLQPQYASLINGVYISVYYAAGALGSLIPLWIYNYFGWTVFLLVIAVIAIAGFYSLKKLPRIYASKS